MTSKDKIGFTFLLGFLVGGLFFSSVRGRDTIIFKSSPVDNKKLNTRFTSTTFTTTKKTEGLIYICKGPQSKRYHYKKSCRGLKPCSTKIFEVSLSKAKEMGRTLCGWED